MGLHGIWVSFLSKDASMILETTEEVFSFLLDPKPHTLDPIYYARVHDRTQKPFSDSNKKHK